MRDGQRGMGLADRLEIGLYGFLVGLIVGVFIGWQFNFLVGTVLNALTVVALLALAAGVYLLWRRFSTKQEIDAAVRAQVERDRSAIEAGSRMKASQLVETTPAEYERRA